MIRLSILLLPSVLLAAQNYGRLSYEGMVHYETETTKGHTINLEQPLPNKVYDDEKQHLCVFYSVLGYELQSSNGRWALNLEGRANIQLEKGEYTTPAYVQKFSFEDINTAMLSEASIDYYTDSVALSIGRNVVDMDWLSGSIDAVMAYGTTEMIEARAFWFTDYYDFQYNYYTKHKEINDGKGISGLYLQSGEALKQLQVCAYYYLMADRQYIVGTKLYTELKPFSLNASYAYLGTLQNAMMKEEEFWRIWSSVIVADNHSFEVGYSRTGNNGLVAMLQFGSHPFSQFYLSNALDRPKAQNGYLQYSYEDDELFFECIGGITSYYGTTLQSSHLVPQWMQSYEVDLNVGYALGDHLLIELSYMTLDLDHRDILEFDQNLFMAELVVQWP